MKKAILVLCFVMFFSLSACGDKEEKKNSQSETVEVTEEKTMPVVITFKDENGNIILSNDDIESVKLNKIDNQGDNSYLVDIAFSDDGSKKLEKSTKELLGQKISVYADDKLVFTAEVEQEITDGKVVITGLAYEEATEIADGFNGT